MDNQPDWDRLTDRELMQRTDRHSREAMVCVGDLVTRYNDLVTDQRTLLREIDRLRESHAREITDLRGMLIEVMTLVTERDR